MQVIDDWARANLRRETILTIGAFDGLHRGHQALIGAVVERARATDRLAALITFYPHPAAVLAPERAPRYLTAPGEQLALLESLGVDLVLLLRFDRELADMPARAFMEKAARHLGLRELWVGADFSLGRDREGDVSRLREIGRELGFDVIVFQTILRGEQAVSSSRIRSLLSEGRVEAVAALLGRNPSLTGRVDQGTQARLQVDPARALPADGVYAALAVMGGERVPALAKVGSDPAPDGGRRTVEVRLLNGDQAIHGCELAVEFVSRLRDARYPEGAANSNAQVEADHQAARCVLSQAEQVAGDQSPLSHAGRYRFREVEHTADRALFVWGREPADLFVGAARGMYGLMGELERLVPQTWRTIRLEATDWEGLLVEWLNELLFLSEQEGLLFTDFCIEPVSGITAETGLVVVASVGGAAAPVSGAHIKAATFHDLKVVRDGVGWSVTFTFDV
jgi:riboflavin kinase/FMN adenylyltransferase